MQWQLKECHGFYIYFSSAFLLQQGHIPDCVRSGECHVWAGGVEEKAAKIRSTKEQGFRLRGGSAWHCVREGSSFAAQLLKDANSCSNPARGPGASDKNEQSVTSAFCDCCPKTREEHSAGWKVLQGFGVLCFVLCCFPQPTSSRHLKKREFWAVLYSLPVAGLFPSL